MGVGEYNSQRALPRDWEVHVGYKITKYLESNAPSFLLTTQLLSGYDDD